jgi:hypothetical protein
MGVGSGNEGSGTTRKTQSAPESRTRRVTTSGTHLPQPENHDRFRLAQHSRLRSSAQRTIWHVTAMAQYARLRPLSTGVRHIHHGWRYGGSRKSTRRLTPRGRREPHPIPATTLLLSLMSNFFLPVYLLVVIAGTTGWVRNIIAVAQSDFTSINGELVIRVIGIRAAPVGAVMGWVP